MIAFRLPLNILFSIGLITAVASAKPKAAPSPPPPAQTARVETLKLLEKRLGGKVTIPDYPSDHLLTWIEERHAKTRTEKGVYRIVGEHLLISQALLKAQPDKVRRSGLLVACETANFTAAQIPEEKWLLARMYQGFILPYISLAYPNARRDPSRQRLIETAVSVFGAAGERDKQIRLLEWLLKMATTSSSTSEPTPDIDQNTQDWARGTLASILAQPQDAPRADLERSLALLQAIESPNMTGFAHLRASVEKRIREREEKDSPETNKTTGDGPGKEKTKISPKN